MSPTISPEPDGSVRLSSTVWLTQEQAQTLIDMTEREVVVTATTGDDDSAARRLDAVAGRLQAKPLESMYASVSGTVRRKAYTVEVIGRSL